MLQRFADPAAVAAEIERALIVWPESPRALNRKTMRADWPLLSRLGSSPPGEQQPIGARALNCACTSQVAGTYVARDALRWRASAVHLSTWTSRLITCRFGTPKNAAVAAREGRDARAR
jgi:hypothetical protein